MNNITPAELKQWIQEGRSFLLIDIREDFEREVFNIGGEHIPSGELLGRKHELPKEGDVILYCEKGIRSTIAIQRLEGFGFHNLYNLSGGMAAWKASIA